MNSSSGARPRRPAAAVRAAGTVIAAALLAGCGGAAASKALPASDRLDPTFVRALDAWCAGTSERFRHAQGAFPVANFDPVHPERDQLPAVARFFAAGDAVRSTIPAGLDALGQPSTGRPAWSRLKSGAVDSTRLAQQQIRAASAADTAAFAAAATAAQQGSRAWSELARSAGLPAGSPCLGLF